MNKSKQLITIIVYFMILLFTSCNIPVMERLSNAIPGITIPKEPIEEIIVKMNPIKVYEKYAIDENCRVMGINGKVLEPVFLTDEDSIGYQFKDFFRKNDKLFFSTVIPEDGPEEIPDSDPVAFIQIPTTHYYVQTGDSVEETEEGLYPLVPESALVEMGITPFSIVTFPYDGSETSRVIKDVFDENGKLVKSLPTGFKMVDGYYVVNEGLWFSVPETISIRLKGVYFYPIDGNLSSSPKMLGRIW